MGVEINEKEGSAHTDGIDAGAILSTTLYEFLKIMKESLGTPGDDATADCEIAIGKSKFKLSVTYYKEEK